MEHYLWKFAPRLEFEQQHWGDHWYADHDR
jgi:hypothetical protein